MAKASFEELIGDLEDFLRQRSLEQWGKQYTRVMRLRDYFAKEVRDLGGKRYRLSGEPEKDANLLLTLCHQETYLLFRQVEGLMRKHEEEGGLTEKLYQRRKIARGY